MTSTSAPQLILLFAPALLVLIPKCTARMDPAEPVLMTAPCQAVLQSILVLLTLATMVLALWTPLSALLSTVALQAPPSNVLTLVLVNVWPILLIVMLSSALPQPGLLEAAFLLEPRLKAFPLTPSHALMVLAHAILQTAMPAMDALTPITSDALMADALWFNLTAPLVRPASMCALL
jgi:hypothetical protein